jgi:hypothetical protein
MFFMGFLSLSKGLQMQQVEVGVNNIPGRRQELQKRRRRFGSAGIFQWYP